MVPRISFDYFFLTKEEEAGNKNPMIVMVDEETGETYARSVSQKGLGEDGELEWLVEDMQKELKNWGHAGGEQSHLIFNRMEKRRSKQPEISLLERSAGELSWSSQHRVNHKVTGQWRKQAKQSENLSGF